MRLSAAVASQAALLAILTQSSSAFAPASFVPHSPVRHLPSARSQPSSVVVDTKLNANEVIDVDQCLLTPEGYGFSSDAERIIKQAKRGENGGYVAVKGDDRVIDVMASITDGDEDVALVYDKTELLGIFTESDYINFSIQRAAAANEEESAAFLVSPVKDFVTPADKLVSVASTDTANQAIVAMQQAGVRHVVVADSIKDSRLSADSTIVGVISMQDVMKQIQKDERLSLDSLQQKFPGLKDPMSQMREEIKSQANEMARDPETAKKDLIRVGTAIFSTLAVGGFLSGSPWLHEHADLAMIGIFILGYIFIIFEEVFEFDKAAVALLMSTGMWVTYSDYFGSSNGIASGEIVGQLGEQLSEVSEICFFLLAASTIVEVVDAHQGFKVVTNKITTTSKKTLFWTIGFLTFFLSAILNNLTVTIVMCSLLKKLVPVEADRKLFGAMVVVAANAGGVWTPIGDVTTTMLWMSNQLSTLPTVTELFLPSVVCLVGSLAFLVNQVEEDGSLENSNLPEPSPLAARGQVVFWSGIASLLAVPVFAEFTGLPPYVAMLTGLGAMWTLTDIIHMGEEDGNDLKVPAALSKLDTSGILFFLGILMSIGVLDKSGILKDLAIFLNENLPSQDIIATVIGLASALIDNVPLVAATQGMYELADYGTDDKLWQLIALCAGTGGSILVIGSASGVALMGLEKVDFLWYAKKVSVGAAVGYFGGIATYLAQNALLHGGLFNSIVPEAMAAVDMVGQNVNGLF
jgi:Na+/H+ antiporter NhaD/arsenite permease-like protein/CBS domain-containing protein